VKVRKAAEERLQRDKIEMERNRHLELQSKKDQEITNNEPRRENDKEHGVSQAVKGRQNHNKWGSYFIHKYVMFPLHLV
jgi:hypothetical protein